MRVMFLGTTGIGVVTLSKYLPSVTLSYYLDYLVTRKKGVYLPALRYPLTIAAIQTVKRLKSQYDLFHAELGPAIACYAAGVPYGLIIYGVSEIKSLFPTTFNDSIFAPLYRAVLRDALYVTVSTRNVFQAVKLLRPDAKLLGEAMDFGTFSPKPKGERHRKKVVLLCVMRMDQWKGHELVWEAIRRLKNRDAIEVYQVDWGWEPYYSNLKKTAPPEVRFIRPVANDNVRQLYDTCDILIGQMKLGVQGVSELEAAACKIPVLNYSPGDYDPFLPKSNTPALIATTLDRLIEDVSFRETYAEQCYTFVRTFHDPSRIAGQLQHLWDLAYEKISSRPGSLQRWLSPYLMSIGLAYQPMIRLRELFPEFWVGPLASYASERTHRYGGRPISA